RTSLRFAVSARAIATVSVSMNYLSLLSRGGVGSLTEPAAANTYRLVWPHFVHRRARSGKPLSAVVLSTRPKSPWYPSILRLFACRLRQNMPCSVCGGATRFKSFAEAIDDLSGYR